MSRLAFPFSTIGGEGRDEGAAGRCGALTPTVPPRTAACRTVRDDQESGLSRVERGRGSESGYSLVELLIAVAVTGLAVVSILNCFTAAGKVTERLEEAFSARWLGTGLKAELDRLPVVDPDQTPQFGCEPGEWDRDRRSFDDLDDYNGWSVSPPETSEGVPNEALAGYRCSVTVKYADPTRPEAEVAAGTTDYVRCAIVVDWNGAERYRSEWLRTVRQ